MVIKIVRKSLKDHSDPSASNASRPRRIPLQWLASTAVAVIAICLLAAARLGDSVDARVLTPDRPDAASSNLSSHPPSPMTTDDQARFFASCAKEATTRGAAHGKLRGLVVASTGKGTTAVVGDGKSTWACNLEPDRAVSGPGRVSITRPRPSDFAVAHNVTSNVLPGDPGEMAWGGGALPKGVTSVAFIFPDGHKEPAITKNGYWVMQYFAETPFAKPEQSIEQVDRIIVRLAGPSGRRTLKLSWGTDTCNQVVHGC
jgi:hypothetical protein